MIYLSSIIIPIFALIIIVYALIRKVNIYEEFL